MLLDDKLPEVGKPKEGKKSSPEAIVAAEKAINEIMDDMKKGDYVRSNK